MGEQGRSEEARFPYETEVSAYLRTSGSAFNLGKVFFRRWEIGRALSIRCAR